MKTTHLLGTAAAVYATKTLHRRLTRPPATHTTQKVDTVQPVPTNGRIVNPGTPPPHKCNEHTAPGRPSLFKINPNTVWQCSCNKYWQMRVVNVVDLEGDDWGTENRWYLVKNADGDNYQHAPIDPDTYLTPHRYKATCTTHGRVRKTHRHYQWV